MVQIASPVGNINLTEVVVVAERSDKYTKIIGMNRNC